MDPKLAPTLGGVGEWGLRFGTRQLCRAAVGYRPLGGNWVSGPVGPPFIWIPGAIVGTQPDVAGASAGFRPQWGGGVSRVGEPSDWISAGASTPNRPRSGPNSAPNRSEIEPKQVGLIKFIEDCSEQILALEATSVPYITEDNRRH